LSLKENALEKLVAYRRAHLAWKAAPEGPQKVATKAARWQARSELFQAAELYENTLRREKSAR
jgi:hypothetical protein